ncbi:MAG: hypothetical protein GY827_03765 [Cytophagales bacterium]|nr:hypothetical protein [Cytophagales bacterium]
MKRLFCVILFLISQITYAQLKDTLIVDGRRFFQESSDSLGEKYHIHFEQENGGCCVNLHQVKQEESFKEKYG